MRKRLTIGVVAAALAATISFVAAGPTENNRVEAAALPPSDIVASVQFLGLVPTTRPFRRGPYYVLHAIDGRGSELRVVADAQLGDIVSVLPVFRPRFDAGPRIIHVPPPGERSDRSHDDDEAALPVDTVERGAPAPRDHAIRRPRHSERRAAQPRPRRSVLSAPPSKAADLSPVHPTPRFKATDDAPHDIKGDPLIGMRSQAKDTKNDAEKFQAPDEQADRSRLPPPGSTPPSAPPPPPAQN